VVRVLRVNPSDPDASAIAEACAVLQSGGLVAFPTETVYGLGARGLDAAASARIFAAKGRPPGHPIILHVDGAEMARSIAREWSSSASLLADAFWPGALTIVVPRAAHVPDVVTGGLSTVGIRAPAHPIALALVRTLGEPIAAPSANAHTHVSPTAAEHVVRSLGDAVDLVIDGGPCHHGIESTVVALGDPPLVLRPGALSLARLAEVVPRVRAANVVLDSDVPRASPGLAAKHYAPRAEVVLVKRGDRDAFRNATGAAIVMTPEARVAASHLSPLVVLPDEPAGYARSIYAALYDVDAAGALSVHVEAPSADDPAWWPVRDRLERAARR
jgi:L-threonylcarbamoyladenylate synthase